MSAPPAAHSKASSIGAMTPFGVKSPGVCETIEAMAIRLQFVREPHFTSRIIAWFGAWHFSHVDAVLPNGRLLGARADAAGGKPPGVHVRPVGYHAFDRCSIMEVPATWRQSQDFYEFLYDQVGKPYDHKAIWGFIINRNWRDPGSWFCSELMAAAGERSLILPTLSMVANKITPVSCTLVFSAAGGKFLT